MTSRARLPIVIHQSFLLILLELHLALLVFTVAEQEVVQILLEFKLHALGRWRITILNIFKVFFSELFFLLQLLLVRLDVFLVDEGYAAAIDTGPIGAHCLLG